MTPPRRRSRARAASMARHPSGQLAEVRTLFPQQPVPDHPLAASLYAVRTVRSRDMIPVRWQWRVVGVAASAAAMVALYAAQVPRTVGPPKQPTIAAASTCEMVPANCHWWSGPPLQPSADPNAATPVVHASSDAGSLS